MTYNLAVWEGDRPADHRAATTTFQAMYAQYAAVGPDTRAAPTARPHAFVQALLDQWPDITDDLHDDSPWATGPLMREAIGPFMCLAIVPARWRPAGTFVAQVAREHGLVCYDPQTERLI